MKFKFENSNFVSTLAELQNKNNELQNEKIDLIKKLSEMKPKPEKKGKKIKPKPVEIINEFEIDEIDNVDEHYVVNEHITPIKKLTKEEF